MTDSIPTESGGTGGAGNTTSEASTAAPTKDQSRRAALRSAGFSDAQIEAIMALADPDDQGNSLTPTHFYSVNRATLNALQYRGKLNENTKNLVYLQAPIAMVQEVSNPANWENDDYIGPGAESLNTFLRRPPKDYSKPSLDALVFSVLQTRAEVIEEQLRDQITAIQQQNKDLEEANDWLANARGRRANAAAGDTDDNPGRSPFDAPFVEYWTRVGARSQGAGNHTKDDWDVNIAGLQGVIEAKTSESQLDSTKLQQTINKYNQSFEMLSSFVNKYYQSLSTTIQNLR